MTAEQETERRPVTTYVAAVAVRVLAVLEVELDQGPERTDMERVDRVVAGR